MDYNIMANQSAGNPLGDSAQYDAWRVQARDTYLAGFRRAHDTNRAPFFIGNHFERWNGGIYMDAVEEAIGRMAQYDDVRFVSFRQLVQWLEAQDPPSSGNCGPSIRDSRRPAAGTSSWGCPRPRRRPRPDWRSPPVGAVASATWITWGGSRGTAS